MALHSLIDNGECSPLELNGMDWVDSGAVVIDVCWAVDEAVSFAGPIGASKVTDMFRVNAVKDAGLPLSPVSLFFFDSPCGLSTHRGVGLVPSWLPFPS